MKASLLFMVAALFLASCNKMAEAITDKATTDHSGFIRYTIPQGQHYSEGNVYKAIEDDEVRFIVKFDSTAIYKTITAENQYDINKLFGFSDNNSNHHQFSARFGWRWSDGALRLFAYVYNRETMLSKELATIEIGKEVNCSIKTSGAKYQFFVNDAAFEMPRTSNTEKAQGYRLYPYFGGDEPAPHDIHIWIRLVD